jgi:acyl-CoA hydrolase
LGTQLRRGLVLHGGFFLGCNAFYQALRDLTESQREDLCMTGVYKINQLDANPDLYKEQRRDARFINTGIMATLNGAVCSDGLANTCVVSGVGGQYNFVAMAHQLLTGRSILMIRAVRDKEGKTSEPTSNIVFNYGHITIPRHLRDIVITEYGVADLRSKTDSEVMKAMLNIADSRFQAGLLRQAIENGKIEADYHIPERYQHNTPEALAKKLASFNLPAFPLGCDLTADELKLGKALKAVKKAASSIPKWKLALQAWQSKDIPASAEPYLKWLKLEQPQNMQDKVVRMLLVKELEKAGVV